jgi:hypothetical protein
MSTKLATNEEPPPLRVLAPGVFAPSEDELLPPHAAMTSDAVATAIVNFAAFVRFFLITNFRLEADFRTQ